MKYGAKQLKIPPSLLRTGAGIFGSRLIEEIKNDIVAVRERDPAAKSNAEVLFLYSGVHALLAYRVSHKLYIKKKYFSARLISQVARYFTGIEIHPGATIGKGLFIDHGMGVVIGETAEIGDNCTIYQGVTLGGTGKDTGKRHPTLGNNVMVGAGAKVLGPFKIGDNSKIAAGAVVLNEIPADSTAVGMPAKVVRRSGIKLGDLDQIHIPDPTAQRICMLESRIAHLEAELSAYTGRKAVTPDEKEVRDCAEGLTKKPSEPDTSAKMPEVKLEDASEKAAEEASDVIVEKVPDGTVENAPEKVTENTSEV